MTEHPAAPQKDMGAAEFRDDGTVDIGMTEHPAAPTTARDDWHWQKPGCCQNHAAWFEGEPTEWRHRFVHGEGDQCVWQDYANEGPRCGYFESDYVHLKTINDPAEELREYLVADNEEYLAELLDTALAEARAAARREVLDEIPSRLYWETVDEFGPEAFIRASDLDSLSTDTREEPRDE